MYRIDPTCPACGSPCVIPIMRDTMPGPESPGLERVGWEILPAGYLLGEDDPDWRCRDCGYEWIDPAIAPPI